LQLQRHQVQVRIIQSINQL